MELYGEQHMGQVVLDKLNIYSNKSFSTSSIANPAYLMCFVHWADDI